MTDELQLLRDFRREVPAPDEETVRRAYAYATSAPRSRIPPVLRTIVPIRPRLAVIAAVVGGAVVVAAVSTIGFGGAGGNHTSSQQSTGAMTLPRGPGGLAAGKLGPGSAPTPVASASGADALLPFTVVVPSNASPTQMGVLTSSHQFIAYYDTANGSYDLTEGPTDLSVSDLQALAQHWQAGPIHEIVQVSGVSVLIQGDADGYTVASWIRGEGSGSVLTFLTGPGVEGQTFDEQDAVAVAANIIRQGG